jgi:hypothetical protein
VVWSHTWGVLLLSLAILYLVGGEQRRWRVHPVILASLMAWTFFVRPTFAISCAVVAIYVLLRLRSIFIGYIVTSLIWLGAFVIYSEYLFGRFLPVQYLRGSGFAFSTSGSLGALAGLLVSPSRGMLIFSPVLIVVILWLVRYRRLLPLSGLIFAGIAVCALHLLLVSAWKYWWGGYGYGPRLMTDVVPWLALLAIAAAVGRMRAQASWSATGGRVAYGAELLAAGALLGLSVLINWRGANSFDTAQWNVSPVSLEVDPNRVWDWTQPQFLAGLVPESGAASTTSTPKSR